MSEPKTSPQKSTVVTGPPWPWEFRQALRRHEAAKYFEAVHALPFGGKHLANLASSGKGPKFRYAGKFPIYGVTDLDAFAESLLGAPRQSTLPRKRQAPEAA